MNHRILTNIRVNYCALRWIAWKERLRLKMWSEVNKGIIVRHVQSDIFRLFNIQGVTVNSVSILFSWHKNLGRVIKRHSFHEEKSVLGETNRTGANFELTSVSGKKYVIDRFIYLHCLKCVLVNATCEREIFKLF